MTTPFLVRSAKSINAARWLQIGLACCFFVSSSLAAEPEPNEVVGATAVGHVTWTLGKAYIESETGGSELVRVGAAVHVNDRIQTASNGLVHVRFVDEALVSVRPGSELQVLRYEYDKTRPEFSTVKFNLVEGVTRAISGDAARSARQRFRLNTPIAAIGVRGTDFVVSATEDTVRALVNEGAIVVAPYSAECTVDTFGPCASNAVELTGNSLQIIELDLGAPLPVLLPAQDERNQTGLQQQVQLASNDASPADGAVEEKTAGTEVYLENVTSNRVTASATKVIQPPVVPVAPDFTPKTALAATALTKNQLVWGRWADGLGSKERITASYANARADRSVTVGSSDYGLFRPENGSIVIDQGLGVVSFSLSSAQAFYSNAAGTSAMRVASGNLNIDFDQSRFATDLNLNHQATGDITFAAQGRISEAGYFNSQGVDQRMAGAVSIDGREAGYFFEKQLLDGGIQGLTLWNSK